MSVAIRAITRIQDGDDAPALGAGQDGYALTWNNATGAFVATALPAAGVTDHGALTGLSDDDHSGYALLAGRAGGQTLYGGDAANDDITIHGTSNATRTTSYVLLQPTAGNVGIGTTAPDDALSITRTQAAVGGITITNTSASASPIAGAGLVLNAGASFVSQWYLEGNSGHTYFIIPSTKAFIVRTGTTTNSHVFYSTGAYFNQLTTAATNAVTNQATSIHNSNLTPAAGFGIEHLFQLKSSTTNSQDAARIQVLWYEATHASRKADLVLTAYDTAEREGLRIRGAGSAAAIGFLGATPAARVAHVADPAGGATVDAEARTAINSILTTLETFGFHATS